MLLRTTTVFLFLCLMGFSQASAQWVNMPTRISTPRGTVKIGTPVYLPHYYNYYRPGNSAPRIVSKKHEFTIVFLNDSTVTAKTKINTRDSVHSLNWTKKENHFIIIPSQTKEIYRLDEIGEKITGKPMDSCWVFLTDTGRINTYSITSDIEDPAIAYVQKGNNKIVPLTDENLIQMVRNNSAAVKLVEEKKLLKAIEVYNQD